MESGVRLIRLCRSVPALSQSGRRDFNLNRSPSGNHSIHTVTDFNIKFIEVTTMGNIAKQRHQAAVRQSFHCFYCGLPMWESSPAALMHQYSLTPAEARLLQCTGEHLKPRGNGGSDQPSNIVATCRHCNGTRHKTPKVLSPEQYQKKVRARVGKGAGFRKGSPARSRGTEPIGFRSRRFDEQSVIGHSR